MMYVYTIVIIIPSMTSLPDYFLNIYMSSLHLIMNVIPSINCVSGLCLLRIKNELHHDTVQYIAS